MAGWRRNYAEEHASRLRCGGGSTGGHGSVCLGRRHASLNIDKSASGRHFGSQVIHHGEQKGYQVTPISLDKASPCYQRPGNLKNPTVAALLQKVMEMDGTEAAAAGPSGMGIISQTYMALLNPRIKGTGHL